MSGSSLSVCIGIFPSSVTCKHAYITRVLFSAGPLLVGIIKNTIAYFVMEGRDIPDPRGKMVNIEAYRKYINQVFLLWHNYWGTIVLHQQCITMYVNTGNQLVYAVVYTCNYES